jgi:uncharacterized delta-60 repeat protein
MSDTKCYAGLPGCLDATFGGIGFVQLDPHPAVVSDTDRADAVAVQPDGKIVLAGRAKASGTMNFVVIRYNVDGTLDTSFGDQDPFNPFLRRGYTTSAVTSGLHWLYSMVLQPDGRIVISGWNNESVVLRYNSDGTLDPTFSSDGIVHLGSEAPAREVALQADGKILVGGGESGFSVARLHPNGSLDSSFGSGGIVTANPSGAKQGTGLGWSMAIQRVPAVTGEERIVVAGWSGGSGQTAAWTLMRFKSNGATDTSFGSSGIVKTAFNGFTDQARRVRIDSNNRIVVAGLIYSANSNCGDYVIDSAVVRYLQNGSIDVSFMGGKQTVDVYGGNESLYAMELQVDGKILIFVTARSADASKRHFALVRLNADGSRDSTFGMTGNGVVTTDFYGMQNWGFAVTVQPADGKIIAAGLTYVSSNNAEIVVARYLP